MATLNGAHTFLPGGEIEPGEGAVQALSRELHEALGACEVDVIRFLGCMEMVLPDDRAGSVHSMTVLFECRLLELGIGPPASMQPHL